MDDGLSDTSPLPKKISDYFDLGSCNRYLARLHFFQPQTSPRGNDIVMDAQSAADPRTAEQPNRRALRRVVEVAFGAILLVASGSTALYGQTPPESKFGISALWINIATIHYVLLLGTWLISGYARHAIQLVSLISFVAFALANLWGVWIGREYCDFFGAISVKPWQALVLDITAILLLFGTSRKSRFVESSTAFAFFASYATTLAMWTTVIDWNYGTTKIAIATIRGDAVIVTPQAIDFGDVFVGETISKELSIQNISDRTITIYGGTTDCNCSTVENLPVTITPGMQVAIKIRLQAPATSVLLERSAMLWSDSATRTIHLRLSARCIAR